MALTTFNPTTPGRRGLILVDRSDLHKGKPEKTLTEGLRKELRAKGSPVRVCSVSPGLVQTEFHGNYYGSDVTHDLRVLDSQDVANAVLYVLAQPPHVQVHDVLMRPTDQVT